MTAGLIDVSMLLSAKPSLAHRKVQLPKPISRPVFNGAS